MDLLLPLPIRVSVKQVAALFTDLPSRQLSKAAKAKRNYFRASNFNN